MFLGKIPTHFPVAPVPLGIPKTGLSVGAPFFSERRQLDSFSQQMPIFSHLGDSIPSPASFFPQKLLLVMFWFYPTRPMKSWAGVIEISSWRPFFFFKLWWVWACLKSFVPCFHSFFPFWQPAFSCKLNYYSCSGLLSLPCCKLSAAFFNSSSLIFILYVHFNSHLFSVAQYPHSRL